jgi:hypothetical protein
LVLNEQYPKGWIRKRWNSVVDDRPPEIIGGNIHKSRRFNISEVRPTTGNISMVIKYADYYGQLAERRKTKATKRRPDSRKEWFR